MNAKLIWYPKCSTCQRAKKWLENNKFNIELVDIKEETPTYEDLAEYYTRSGVPLKKLFNTSGLKYKELQLKDQLPSMTEQEQLILLATDGMLIKRPILIADNMVYFGFKEAEWSKLI